MGYFDDWTAWGRALRDDDFARAWLALGIVAAQESVLPSLEESVRSAPGEPDAIDTAIALSMQRAIAASRDAEPFVAWRFPSRHALGKALEAAPPLAWSRAWQRLAKTQRKDWLGNVRVRVVDIPSDEATWPWYSALLDAVPAPGAVSIRVSPPNPQLFVDWPLRLATLEGNPAGAILDRVATLWPSNRLARVRTLERGASNCDVLVLAGRGDAVHGSVASAPGNIKADLVVLLGVGPDGVESDVLSTEIMRLTHASGTVAVRDLADAAQVADAVNGVVYELSHDRPLDAAIAGWARAAGRPVARLSDDLANVRLSAVATQISARLARLPKDATIDLSAVHNRDAWRVREQTGDILLSAPEAAHIDVTSARAESVTFEVRRLEFDRESHGASELATAAEVIDAATEPEAAVEARAQRFLQQQSFVRNGDRLDKADGGFVAGRTAIVRVRIGLPDEAWDRAGAVFPEHRLPQHYREWRLTVWLTEPTHLESGVCGQITLSRTGDSTAADLEFTPKSPGDFDGRLTVLHRGRVLQTAALVARIRRPDGPAAAEGTPHLAQPVAVRRHIGDLDDRREFDAAFVLNHNGADQPRAVTVSEDAAGVRDLAPALRIAANINTALGAVAGSVDDYKDGLTGQSGRDLLIRLAQHGERLRISLVNNLTPAALRETVAAAEFIQVVSTRPDTIVPFEFIYDYAAPDNDAALCPQWKTSLETGDCGGACDRTSGRFVCPGGFWGIRKVIERHAAVPDALQNPADAFLQSEPQRRTSELRLGRGALVAISQRVQDPLPKELVDAVTASLGAPALTATSWKLWRDAVERQKPGLIVALTHTDGSAHQTTLEVGGDTLETILLRRQHVFPDGSDGQPLVALIGCDTAGTAEAYGEPIAVFRDRGAAVIVGTIATVFGGHATKVAQLLVKELLPAQGTTPERLGEAIRAVRRRGVLDNLLMAMCLVAYGDADWRLAH